MQYRRAYHPGGSYFFTLVAADRRPILQSGEAVEILRKSFRQVMKKYPFSVDAAVILPDHLHCIWTLPSDDKDFSTRWRLIKTWFTKHCPKDLRGEISASRRKKNEQAIWQHRFWEHLLRNELDYRHHVEYIHYNPVKHGYVTQPCYWPYSSFQHYVRSGIYPSDWGFSDPQSELKMAME